MSTATCYFVAAREGISFKSLGLSTHSNGTKLMTTISLHLGIFHLKLNELLIGNYSPGSIHVL